MPSPSLPIPPGSAPPAPIKPSRSGTSRSSPATCRRSSSASGRSAGRSRGPSGHVYALASDPAPADPKEPVLALAGCGAMISRGEILLVNPKNGRLFRALEGHRETVSSLAFSADGNWLVSSDLTGQTILWKRGQWKPDTVYESDEQTYGKEAAKLIEARGVEKRLAVIAGKGRLIAPLYVGQAEDRTLRWQLQDVKPRQPPRLSHLEPFHRGTVTALAATPDGSWLASADWVGDFFTGKEVLPLGPRAGKSQPRRRDLAPGSSASASARTAARWPLEPRSARRPKDRPNSRCGTPKPSSAREAELARTTCRPVPSAPTAANWRIAAASRGRSSAGRWTAAGMPGCCTARPPGATGGLRGQRAAVSRGFRHRAPLPRLQRLGDLQGTFDPQRLAANRSEIAPADWLSPDRAAGGWTAKRTPQGTLQLYLKGQPKGRVALDTVLAEGAEHATAGSPTRKAVPSPSPWARSSKTASTCAAWWTRGIAPSCTVPWA